MEMNVDAKGLKSGSSVVTLYWLMQYLQADEIICVHTSGVFLACIILPLKLFITF